MPSHPHHHLIETHIKDKLEFQLNFARATSKGDQGKYEQLETRIKSEADKASRILKRFDLKQLEIFYTHFAKDLNLAGYERKANKMDSEIDDVRRNLEDLRNELFEEGRKFLDILKEAKMREVEQDPNIIEKEIKRIEIDELLQKKLEELRERTKSFDVFDVYEMFLVTQPTNRFKLESLDSFSIAQPKSAEIRERSKQLKEKLLGGFKAYLDGFLPIISEMQIIEAAKKMYPKDIWTIYANRVAINNIRRDKSAKFTEMTSFANSEMERLHPIKLLEFMDAITEMASGKDDLNLLRDALKQKYCLTIEKNIGKIIEQNEFYATCENPKKILEEIAALKNKYISEIQKIIDSLNEVQLFELKELRQRFFEGEFDIIVKDSEVESAVQVKLLIPFKPIEFNPTASYQFYTNQVILIDAHTSRAKNVPSEVIRIILEHDISLVPGVSVLTEKSYRKKIAPYVGNTITQFFSNNKGRIAYEVNRIIADAVFNKGLEHKHWLYEFRKYIEQELGKKITLKIPEYDYNIILSYENFARKLEAGLINKLPPVEEISEIRNIDTLEKKLSEYFGNGVDGRALLSVFLSSSDHFNALQKKLIELCKLDRGGVPVRFCNFLKSLFEKLSITFEDIDDKLLENLSSKRIPELGKALNNMKNEMMKKIENKNTL